MRYLPTVVLTWLGWFWCQRDHSPIWPAPDKK